MAGREIQAVQLAVSLRRALVCLVALTTLCSAAASATSPPELPGRYFQLLAAGAELAEARLKAETPATLEKLETRPDSSCPSPCPWFRWTHFPYSILAAAVLYAKPHPTNQHYKDPRMLNLAIQIGDLLADENERGVFEPRLDSDWDTYMWLEAYRLLEQELGEARRARWKQEIEKVATPFVSDATKRLEFPWYNTPYIGTSPNHYSQWASLLFLAGHVFGHKEWEDLGARVLHRFAAEEQTPDGYWGELNRGGPTIGYDHITMTQVALYWEYSHDAVALKALRRSTDFHIPFTYPDGQPVETLNDRNRYWRVNSWGHFGFSNFPDGRRYAQFLTGFFTGDTLTMDALGRLAQDALYYHEGPLSPIPQDNEAYSSQLSVPAGIRKRGPWVVSLSGLLSPQAVSIQYYLDRQSHLSVFHDKTGLIITGANSKRQPELATFTEKIGGQIYHMPISSRLQMKDGNDRLSLAYNTFFVDVYSTPATPQELKLQFVMTGHGPAPDAAQLNLQLALKSGEVLETGTGRKYLLGKDRLELSSEQLGGIIRHHGWTMKVDPSARLVWPIHVYNPYSNGPEETLEHAVGALTVPLVNKKVEEDWYVRPAEQTIFLVVDVD